MAVELGRFGLWIASYAWSQVPSTELAPEIEALGYGTVWIGAAAGDLALPEEILAATSTLRVATGIVSIWTVNANDAAEAYARVEAAAPGRFVLGLGVSHELLVEGSGQRYERPYQKMVTFLDELDAAPHEVPVDRRVLAALGPKMLALSGTRGGGAHPYLITPAHTARAREILGDGPLLAPEQKVVLATDPAVARAAARQSLAIYMQLPNYTRNLEQFGFTVDDFADRGSDRLVDALVAWGDAETVVARLREHHDAGADHVAIQVLNTETDPSAGRMPLPRAEWRELAAALVG